MSVKYTQYLLLALAEKTGEKKYSPGSADGVTGAMTKAAVLAFQTDWGNGLVTDGVPGPKTDAALLEALENGMPERRSADPEYASADYDNSPDWLWSFLLERIGNAYGTAGLLGNLNAESDLVAACLEIAFRDRMGYTSRGYTEAVDNGSYGNFANDNAGYGIAQWTDRTRKAELLAYAKSLGASIGNRKMQAEFLMAELEGKYPKVLQTLKTAENVRQASNAVLSRFECPLDQSTAVQETRERYGLNYYNKFCAGKAETEYAGQYLQTDGCYHIPRGVNVQLSRNLWAREIHCQGVGCCTESIISQRMVQTFQKIREDAGVPITIGDSNGSGYRCPTHNAAPDVRGAANSLHVTGNAMDLHCTDRNKLLAAVEKNVTDGEIGTYSWGYHVGVWDRGYVNRFTGN